MTWPMTLRALMLHGTVVIDAWLVAVLGEDALAALGLAGAIGGLLLGALMAFANAAQILVAQAWGSGRAESIKTAFATGLIISFGVCALGLVCLLVLADPILRGSAQNDIVYAEARRYLFIFAGVVLAEAAGQSLTAFFNGCGKTRAPFLSYAISVPVNVGVSYALIHGLAGLPEMGLAGAAVGTVCGAVVRALYLAAQVSGQSHWRSARADPLRTALRHHLRFALPVAATFISAHASASACMLIYAAYDVIRFAALTLILPWVQVVGAFGMSWAQACGISVAQHLGSGSVRAELNAFLRMAWRGAFVASLLVSTFYATVVLSAGMLYPSLQPETRAALLTFLPTLLLLPWPKNSNAICGNTLRAAGQTVYVMHIFVWSQWLFKVPATAVLVLWLKAPVGWVVFILLAEEFVKFGPFHRELLMGRWYERARRRGSLL